MRLKEIILLTNEYYGKDISDEVLNMYFMDLQDLPENLVIESYNKWRLNPKNRRAPLPAEIREILSPKINSDYDAIESAARIISAIPKFGWCNGKDAQEYIGPLGWRVVLMQGGWRYLCETHMSKDDGILQAQCRDLAKATQNRSKLGLLDQAPQLEQKEVKSLHGADTKQGGLTKGNFSNLLGAIKKDD